MSGAAPGPLSLRDRVAIVTGGGQGIGRAVARRYAHAGAHVLIGDVSEENAEQSAEVLSAEVGADVARAQVDVSSEDSVRNLAAIARDRWGRVDVWANFAAIYPMRPEEFTGALDFPLAEWKRELDVNLTGSFLCSRTAAREMVDAGSGGVIINTSTTLVDRHPGHPGMLAYVSSKGGIEQLTMMLAAELGEHGIRVLAIKPTVVATEGMAEHLKSVSVITGSEDYFDELERMMPLRRFGQPDDIASIALFAASDLAAFMTGCVLQADGGEACI